jgi:hypothetical protein
MQSRLPSVNVLYTSNSWILQLHEEQLEYILVRDRDAPGFFKNFLQIRVFTLPRLAHSIYFAATTSAGHVTTQSTRVITDATKAVTILRELHR